MYKSVIGNGIHATLQLVPFHITSEGLENKVLFKTNEDYITAVNYIHICALAHGVTIVVYIVLSNHVHMVILAPNFEKAKAFGDAYKKIISQYLESIYGHRRYLHKTEILPQYLYNDWYIKNAIAYDLANSYDAGVHPETYRWSSMRAYFCDGKTPTGSFPLRILPVRQVKAIFRTHVSLKNVNWYVNSEYEIEPASAVDYKYVESAFHSHQGLMQAVFSADKPHLREKLVDGVITRRTDTEFIVTVEDLCQKYFKKSMRELTHENKVKLVSLAWRSFKTSPAQLARCCRLKKDEVRSLLRLK